MAIERDPDSPPIVKGWKNLQPGLESAMYTTSSFCLITLAPDATTLSWELPSSEEPDYSFLSNESKSSEMWLAWSGTALTYCFICLAYCETKAEASLAPLLLETCLCTKNFVRNIFNLYWRWL